MDYLFFLVVLLVSWGIGVVGWAQIIGSIQNIRVRPNLIITIIIWGIIIAGSFFIVRFFFESKMLAWAIAMVVSFVQVFKQGKIE
ncbi:hypothetical protein [Butyrivibrio sp. M55]|uniref:hypothetical protein n=1 Tax=Butyrivibrio sp. M55 TaxID=1855323 RepID=UPI0008E91608|nr:hypothetical protein [Butyrivibrio sp. M55]SFU96344.1 hypothetical protein SAMN05216540_1314 [Butyrivibrio sp. M55]